MNCRPDDLAYITGATLHPSLNGRVVRVERRAIPGERMTLPCGVVISLSLDRTADWIVSASMSMPLMLSDGEVIETTVRPIGDNLLRPIRGQEGRDQTLTWAGLPTVHLEPA